MSSSSLSPVAATGAAAASEVDSVVVTAERRNTDLQHTALAVSAVKSDALDKSFTNDYAGLNAVVPSLEITKSSGFENLVTIRGVGSETPENAPSTVPGVSLFVDGVYIANTVALDETLFDIDHIEVLRGPQGALYGQSSIGGAINVNTAQPQLGVFSGKGDVAFGDYALSRERAMLNIPIGDDLALRLSAQKYDHSGFTKDLAIPGFTLDDAHDASGKAALLWKPTSDFSATFTGEWYHSSQNGAAQKSSLDPIANPRALLQDYPDHFALTNQVYHLNLEYDAPWFVVKSVSAYQYLNQVQAEDSSRSAFSVIGSYDDVAAWNTKVESYTEEFDILSKPGSKLDWIVGAFVIHQTTRQFVEEFEGKTAPTLASVTANPAYAAPPYAEFTLTGTGEPANLAYGNITNGTRNSYSGFGQATYHVTSWLRLTGGVRYNVDDNRLNSFNFSAFNVGSNPVTASNDSIVTWKGEVDADVTPQNLVYFSAAEGYKPGGLNGISNAQVVPDVFKPEKNTAFQVGSKNTFFDHALRLNVDAFYYLYQNMQYIETDPVPFDGGMANIPNIHVYGIEAEGSYTGLDDRLRINADLAYERGQVQGSYFSIDSTIQQKIESQGYPSPCAFGGAYYNPGCWAAVEASARNLAGSTPPAMPTFSGSINASYRIDTEWGALTPRVEVVYRGAEWARIFNEPSLDRVPSYTVANLNLEFIPAKQPHLKLDLSATNVGNVAGINSQYTDPYGTFTTSRQYIPPRQIIGSVSYAF